MQSGYTKTIHTLHLVFDVITGQRGSAARCLFLCYNMFYLLHLHYLRRQGKLHNAVKRHLEAIEMSSMQHQHREGGLVGDQRSLRTLIASTILLICEREYMKAGEKLNKGRVTSEHQKLLNEMQGSFYHFITGDERSADPLLF